MESIVIIFIGIVACVIVIKLIAGLAEWTHNNAQPIVTKSAKIISKRIETRRRTHHHYGHHGHDHQHHHGHLNHHDHTTTSMDYFITFEIDSGERMRFEISGDEYDLLAEGDNGELTHQGTRYHGFRRMT